MIFEEAVAKYMDSHDWQRLSPRSRRIYTDGLKTIAGLFHRQLKDIRRVDVIAFSDGLRDKPGKLRIGLTIMRNIFNYAYDRGWVEHNPAGSIKGIEKSEPFLRWSEAELETFLSTAPPPVKLVMLLALYTGQRRCDLARLPWSAYDGRHLRLTQQKTGAELVLPVHPRLKAVLDATERKGPTIATNFYGERWVPESMRQAVRRHAASVGINGKTLHGVRKTTASMLAEMGCTPWQVRSITGHQSLKEVERYTKQADQKRLAEEAMTAWE